MSAKGDAEEITDDSGDGDGGGGGGIVKSTVLGILVGSVLSLVTQIVGYGLDLVKMFNDTMRSGGAVLESQARAVGGTFVDDVLLLPIEEIGSIAQGAGIFAPIYGIAIFAIVSAVTAALIYALWRLVVIVT